MSVLRYLSFVLVLPGLLVAPGRAAAQEGTAPGWVDIDQLSAMRVTMTSVRAKPLREQPGVVTAITARQIREMGARDLMDVLRHVPGFYFGQDVVGVVGPSFRGLWAHEGKLHLVVDGMEFNETLFGTLQFGHHIPADAIERIEIIRGPGSAIYGGTAELGVVRVTTKGAAQEGGYGVVTVSAVPGRAATDYVGGIGTTEGDWRVAANGFFTSNFRSNRRYEPVAGDGFDMTRDADIRSRLATASIGWRDLQVQVLHDLHEIDDRVAYGTPLPRPIPISFESTFVSVRHDVRVSDRLSLTPLFSYRTQVPWKTGGAGSFEVTSTRYTAALTGVADVSDAAVLRAGVDVYRDGARAVDTAVYGVPAPTFYAGRDSVHYQVWSPYAQFDWDTPLFSTSIGGRFEHHSYVGSHFVPRFAVTRAWERLHLKALVNQAYRTPNVNILNYPNSAAVKAERTTALEIEAGYALGRGLSFVGNVFRQRLEDPIIYTVDPITHEPAYSNDREIGNVGAEVEIRYSRPTVSTYVGYSFSRLLENTVSVHDAGVDGSFLGLPSHKLTGSVTWYPLDRLTWNLSGVQIGGLRAFTPASAAPAVVRQRPLVSSYLEYRWNTLALGLGCSNLLDGSDLIAQPYNGGSAPIPLKGRDVYVKATVGF
jgi:outer membrane cobalamin receptor